MSAGVDSYRNAGASVELDIEGDPAAGPDRDAWLVEAVIPL